MTGVQTCALPILVLLVSLFLSQFKNDQSSYHLPVNTKGFGSFLDYYNIVVSSIGGITITNLGLVFCVLASSNSI